MEISILNAVYVIVFLIFISDNVSHVHAGETCTTKHGVQEYCDYGCCGSGNDISCCSISTSVLLVASIVSGLVLIALVAAIVVCCYKNYKDKRATRVRRMRQEQDMNAPRVPGVEPPKPPSYISAPPAYSEEMPESHFRPQTVTGHISYNQRFRGTTPVARGLPPGAVSTTTTSGRHPVANHRSYRHVQIPGSVQEGEAPPPYTEFVRGQTPANRRRRFIRTPVPEITENANEQNVANGTVEENTDIFSEVSQESVTPSHAQQTGAQGALSQPSRADSSRVVESRVSESRAVSTRAMESRATESRAVTTRAQESRAETIRETESRADTITRVLRPSRISRIPTRVQGAQSRQLSDVQSRASSLQTPQTNMTSNSSNPSDFSYSRRNNAITEEHLDLAAI